MSAISNNIPAGVTGIVKMTECGIFDMYQGDYAGEYAFRITAEVIEPAEYAGEELVNSVPLCNTEKRTEKENYHAMFNSLMIWGVGPVYSVSDWSKIEDDEQLQDFLAGIAESGPTCGFRTWLSKAGVVIAEWTGAVQLTR